MFDLDDHGALDDDAVIEGIMHGALIHQIYGAGPRHQENTMTSNDPLDQPVTLRALVDTYDELKRGRATGAGSTPSFKQVLRRLVKEASESDYIRVDFGGSIEYIYRIAAQPTSRRVQVGDLVTVPPSSMNSFPQVVRVTEINVPKPKSLTTKAAVAISPADAERIESALGPVYSRHATAAGRRIGL
jgi:hypothetical protein